MKIDHQPVTVPCGLCNAPTEMASTRRCDRCWELEARIKHDLALARQILESCEQEMGEKA